MSNEEKEEVLWWNVGETLLEGEEHVKIPWDSLCRMVLWKLLNTCGWIFSACLLLQLKSRSARGASHNPAFMSNCRTTGHTFHSPIYPVTQWVKEMRTWGRSAEITFHFFIWRCFEVHCFGLKNRVQGEYLMCIVSAKITKLGGGWNVNRAILHEFHITFVIL